LIDVLPYATSIPALEVAVNGLPSWKIMRHRSPLDAIVGNIRVLRLSPPLMGLCEGCPSDSRQGLSGQEFSPLGITQVALDRVGGS